ncbi:hypothetical protein [Streptomyces racemochromogenes]
MRWIHLLNAQHDARIAAYHFSDPLPRPPGLPDDTRLHLTVDPATPAGPARSRPTAGRSTGGTGGTGAHSGET